MDYSMDLTSRFVKQMLTLNSGELNKKIVTSFTSPFYPATVSIIIQNVTLCYSNISEGILVRGGGCFCLINEMQAQSRIYDFGGRTGIRIFKSLIMTKYTFLLAKSASWRQLVIETVKRILYIKILVIQSSSTMALDSSVSERNGLMSHGPP